MNEKTKLVLLFSALLGIILLLILIVGNSGGTGQGVGQIPAGSNSAPSSNALNKFE